ncbi:MAG: N(G),N(G)-dimethylarginine dimethylaminohydrolase [Candidatus Neomarinimicrobiota bacterium]|nr:MAG: N(G),N(G)-dimethylarginine dimethylaminohydrolase [Candidatus Neomarinimicrobiota bacterium]
MEYNRAIVRKPGRSVISGLTSQDLGQPDYNLALNQHQSYVRALKACGLELLELPPLESFPDSTFVEDVAIVTEKGAVLTRPGAPSRTGEINFIHPVLKRYFPLIYMVQPPGTVDAGDVLRIENHFIIGLSKRTNTEGARQVSRFLTQLGFTTTQIQVRSGLHLKSEVSYLGRGYLLTTSTYQDEPEFAELQRLVLPSEEAYAANSIQVNGTVLIPSGFPTVKSLVEGAGFNTRSLYMTEFEKVDGGLSCLSLRFRLE